MHPYLSNGILVMLWMYFKHHAAVATKRLLSSGKACNLGKNGGLVGMLTLFFSWFCWFVGSFAFFIVIKSKT